MSNFASHPYHTMSAVHAFGHVPPLSPPGTDQDSPHAPHGASSFLAAGAELDRDSRATPDRLRLHPRRTTMLSYQNSSTKDLRDRNHARGPRNLVVVIPPPDFPLDQGQLGNVLSMGPRHRLSQGILMPLFTSMYGQLNAIAREYNFPSTVGICLYLHICENGITMTPRISDDSWQYLFGHLFEGRSPTSAQQLPIGGSIEFDIDLNRARWFDAWVSGTLRDPEPMIPPAAPSHSPSIRHWGGDSRTMNGDEEQPIDERWDASGSQTLATNSRSATLRHLPKKLSLVDRLEAQVMQSAPEPQVLHDSFPVMQPLSPILQPAVPRTAKTELERRVNSWRTTTELNPVSLAEAYQPTPDTSVPVTAGTMDEYALGHNLREAVNLAEYRWSVTSPIGPVSESPVSSESYHLPSVHLDRRANGSVLITSGTATNCGPADGAQYSDESRVPRLPAPDLVQRMVEDTKAPRHYAVWGSSFGWHSAMTWRKVYPYSVGQEKSAIQIQLQGSGALLPHYPNLVIYPVVYPHLDIYPSLSLDDSKPSVRPTWGSSFGWQRETTWRMVWPYSMATVLLPAPVQLRGAGNVEPGYPNLCIYPAVYPHFDIYPACVVEEDMSQPVSVVLRGPSALILHYPNLVIYPAVYPNFDVYPSAIHILRGEESDTLRVRLYSSDNVLSFYPSMVIYPAVYPHFDLYPAAMKITGLILQKEDNMKLVNNTGNLTSAYPDLVIYPAAYPYLDVYPAREVRTCTANAVWGASFGWQTADSWLKVYPFHDAKRNSRGRQIEGRSDSIAIWANSPGCKKMNMPAHVTSRFPSLVTTSPTVDGSLAVWGTSFGWKNATTWRAVWPTSAAQKNSNIVPISVHLPGSSSLSLGYPNIDIYPAVHPYFDIHPSHGAAVEGVESQVKEHQHTIDLVPHYPNLVIYPAAYPHFDLYPPFSKAAITVERAQGQSSLGRRRIEAWRARTAAQVGLAGLIANNHYWEADEPLKLNIVDYAWSVSSAGPPSPPLQSVDSPYRPPSVYVERRVEGSVPLTPSTATTWGPPDDDYSDVASIERLPSPDLGQRMLPLRHQPWMVARPIVNATSRETTFASSSGAPGGFVPEYPDLVIYKAAYPHFDIYPAWARKGASENQNPEPLDKLAGCPILDIYPAIYPHFNIYPSVDVQIIPPIKATPGVQFDQVQVKLPALYPSFNLYPPSYPYNLDSIYPVTTVTEDVEVTELPRGYPWLVIYPSVYPFVTPYPGFTTEISRPPKPAQHPPVPRVPEWRLVSIKLPAPYPTLDLYPSVYPWNLESVYPSVTAEDYLGVSVRLPSRYPWIDIYPALYPFVQPYPSISGIGDHRTDPPGSLDPEEHERARGFLTPSKLKPIDPVSLGNRYGTMCIYPAVYPNFDLYPTPLIMEAWRGGVEQPGAFRGWGATPLRSPGVTRRKRKTHVELHTSVFRSLEKQPARNAKTHLQLHNDMFQDGVVWTPSGYVQDLAFLTEKKREDTPVKETRHRPPPIQEVSTPRLLRSRSGTATGRSPESIVFPLGQLPAMPPMPPLRVRSPGVSSQPSPAVAESPMPRISPSPGHTRTTSSRFSQAVKSIIPGMQRRNSSAALKSPTAEDHKEHAKGRQSPTRFMSLVDRRPTVVPPLPNISTSEFLSRSPPFSQRGESLVLQRTKAYEQAAAASQSSGPLGVKGTPQFPLPPLPSIPPLMESIEKSKVTFA
ncbi:hypothetical protein BDN67DRAFT_301185 [Paxillus ammoniavirescens]|nr:hypothetical protein BDN67DRAFT_301185 [Paxillus ammoniavirescens]